MSVASCEGAGQGRRTSTDLSGEALRLRPRLLAWRTAALMGACMTGALAFVLPNVASANAAAAQPASSALTFSQVWSTGPLSQDEGEPIAESSPMVADLDGEPAVVVGDRTGYLYAYHLADGSTVPGWSVSDGGAPIDSTPSVAALGAGALDTVFVGAGNAQSPDVGGYEAYSPSGQRLWLTSVSDPSTDPHPAYGVQASLTVADLQGGTDVFAGSLDQETYALNASDGSVLDGWPFFSADSVFSTAAAGDLYGTGQQELVVGGASTAGLAMGQSYTDGGHVRVLDAQGALIYDYDTNQEVDSSPAVGGFLAGGTTGIVVGTGSYWPGASDTDTLKAFTTRLGLVWSDPLDGHTSSSPALADVEGNGQLDVVEGTDTGTSGSVWVIDGATGATIWHEAAVARVIGSVVTADLTGDGYQDLLVPTIHGVEVLDGLTGAEVTLLGPDLGFQNSPLVTDDLNGTVGITIAGYDGDNEGVVQHYEIPGSDGTLAVGPGSWPMFHHDPQLSGTSSVLPDVGNLTSTGLTAQGGNAQVSLSWAAPSGTSGLATGYNIYEGDAPGHEAGNPVNGTTPVTTTGYTATGLTNGRKYYFEVTAISATGEGAPSNEASAVPAGPPGPPTRLSATPANDQVSLTWAAPASDGGSAVTGYNIYGSTTPGTEGSEVESTITATASTVSGLADGTPYYFEVTAINAAGEGAPSAQVQAVPSALATTTTTTTTTTTLTSTASTTLPPTTSTTTITPSTSTTTAPATTTPLPSFPSPVTVSSPPPATPAAVPPTTTPAGPVTGASTGPPAPPQPTGYRVVGSDGDVFALGKVASYHGARPSSPAVGVASVPGGKGYWLVLKDGAVLSAGDAHPYGPTSGKDLGAPAVGIAPTPDGHGYWIVTSKGGVYGFGDAHFYGSLGTVHLNRPIVGMAATADGRGYWMVASDGGVYGFGDAHFYGSLGTVHLNRPIVGMAATADGRGYWMVASDGGVFSFGDAPFFGSLGGKGAHIKVIGIAV
jgi:hypothetical protein